MKNKNEIVSENRKAAVELLQLGVIYHRGGLFAKAVEYYQQALVLDSGFIPVLQNMGSALHDLGLYENALSVYDRALELNPQWGEVLYNRGNTLMSLDRYSEAIESYHRCVEILPEHIDALVTMGTALECLGDYDNALPLYEQALARCPDCAEAHWNRGLSLLRKGEYAEGWREFEWRWLKKGYTTTLRKWDCPRWDGRVLRGETVLIHAEQAFGDTLQFLRYLPLVAARGAKVAVECPGPLVTLVKQVDGVTSVSSSLAMLRPYDYHVPLLSLPYIFNTTVETIPDTVPYLSPTDERVDYWSHRVIQDSTLKVGLVWAGRKTPDPHRTCGFRSLWLLAAVKGVTYYSLQIGEGNVGSKELPIGMNFIDLTSEINDFADTAAIVELLDLVISIDTATAHLAGAMGKPTFLLLPFAPDWRWMIGRKDSPWYPTMKIFRQKQPLDWQGVVYEVKYELLNKVLHR